MTHQFEGMADSVGAGSTSIGDHDDRSAKTERFAQVESLLLHVVDASSVHAPHQTAHVFKVLAEIGAEKTAQILVMNKADILPPGVGDIHELAQRILGETRTRENSSAIAVSALSGVGFDDLLALIDRMLPLDPVSHARFRFPASEGSVLHLLHERARVLSTKYSGDDCVVEAEVPASVRGRLETYVIE